MLCISGIVDDVMFLHNGLYGASCAFLGETQSKLLHRFKPNFINDKDKQIYIVGCTQGAKSAIIYCLVIVGLYLEQMVDIQCHIDYINLDYQQLCWLFSVFVTGKQSCNM